jgi:hypothetical protein
VKHTVHILQNCNFVTIYVQADLIICGLFICEFEYMQLRIILIYRTYPLIYSHPWSFYTRIRYMRVIFYGSYLSHITRSACTINMSWMQVKVMGLNLLILFFWKCLTQTWLFDIRGEIEVKILILRFSMLWKRSWGSLKGSGSQPFFWNEKLLTKL